MTKPSTSRLLSLQIALVVALGACVEPQCPDGTIASDGRCVEDPDAAMSCLETCAGDTPTCDPASGLCVGCISNADCGDATPVCSATTKACVACTSDMHCGGETPVCDIAAARCVGCVENADCTAPAFAACDPETRTCVGCTNGADCAHLPATPICDAARGTCLDCTPATEAARCGDNSCNVLTNTCTTTPRRSLDYCSACTSDSECPANARCARRPILGGLVEYVCLYDATVVPCGASTRPYADAANSPSIDGSVASICYSSLNTCDAVTAYLQGRACSLESQCSGGSCVNGVCSILCGNQNGCRVGDACSNASCVDD